MTGIYKIENRKNGKVYIGQAIDIERRWREHLSRAKMLDTDFYKDLQEYGKDNFCFSVLEVCEAKDLDKCEAKWIRRYNSYDFGYNNTRGAAAFQHEHQTISVDVLQYEKMLKLCRPSTLKFYIYIESCKAWNKTPKLEEFCRDFGVGKSTAYAAKKELDSIKEAFE